MRALVTGGAGFIGSHTVDLLLEKGYEVTILDSLEKPVHARGRPSYLPARANFIPGDVRKREDLERALSGADVVFHLAAYQDYLPDFSKFFHVNTVGTALLYELIVEKKLPVRKVVLASSQSVYGEGKYHCASHGVVYPPLRPLEQLTRSQWDLTCPACGAAVEPLPCDEATVNPHNQYALSKYTQEMVGLNLGRRYDIPTVAMRYSITQGPRQSFHNAYSGICRIFCTRMLYGHQPTAYEDGQQLRDYVYVGDVARANVLVMEDDRANYQVFNVGGDHSTTVLEYAGLVASVLGNNLQPAVPGKFRFGDTRHVVSDVKKLRALGWEPTVPLRQIVEEYIRWARAQPGIGDHYPAAEKAMEKMGTIRAAALS